MAESLGWLQALSLRQHGFGDKDELRSQRATRFGIIHSKVVFACISISQCTPKYIVVIAYTTSLPIHWPSRTCFLKMASRMPPTATAYAAPTLILDSAAAACAASRSTSGASTTSGGAPTGCSRRNCASASLNTRWTEKHGSPCVFEGLLHLAKSEIRT